MLEGSDGDSKWSDDGPPSAKFGLENVRKPRFVSDQLHTPTPLNVFPCIAKVFERLPYLNATLSTGSTMAM